MYAKILTAACILLSYPAGVAVGVGIWVFFTKSVSLIELAEWAIGYAVILSFGFWIAVRNASKCYCGMILGAGCAVGLVYMIWATLSLSVLQSPIGQLANGLYMIFVPFLVGRAIIRFSSPK